MKASGRSFIDYFSFEYVGVKEGWLNRMDGSQRKLVTFLGAEGSVDYYFIFIFSNFNHYF